MGVVVHIGIWPILVYYFRRLSFGGLIANWTVFPMSGILMVLGLSIGTWGVLCPASMPQIAVWMVRVWTRVTLALIRWMAAWRFVAIAAKPPPWPLIGLYYGMLFSILLIVRRRKNNENNRPRY